MAMAGVDGISIAAHRPRGAPYLIYKGTLAPSTPVPCITPILKPLRGLSRMDEYELAKI
jgi:hypothetical protein